MKAHLKPLTFLLSLALFVGACGPAGSEKDDNIIARSGPAVATGEANIGGPYELINQNGETVTEQSFIGKPQIIFFGFAYCPDVCPMALQQIGAVLSDIDPKGEIFTPIFISVDPERDTPEELAVYVTNNGFPKGLVGLTGSPEQIEKAKLAYKVYSTKVPDPDSTAGYTVDHASLIFVIDRDGKFHNVFTHTSTMDDIKTGLSVFK